MDEAAAARAHAPSTVSVPAVIAGVALMVAGIVGAIAAATFVSGRVPSPRAAPNNAVQPQVSGAVQRTAPADERIELLREKRRRLDSSGIDAQSGKRHIPIDQAMRLMVDERAAR